MDLTADSVGLDRDLAVALRDLYALDTFIETGTYRGETCTWAATEFARVYSIESDPRHWQRVKDSCQHFSNLELLLGDSRRELPALLAKIEKPALIWLDAHLAGLCKKRWISNDQCPLIDELNFIRQSGMAHVVLIDDAKWFIGRPNFDFDPGQFPTLDEIRRLLPKHRIDKWTGWNLLVCQPGLNNTTTKHLHANVLQEAA